ncbi:shikimate 5-dehydrogenase [Lachnospiraceae bacterium MD335]|nr:shikimate 5-dehydrogenase [Lachnospiraceae bacterium MD335]
MIEINGKTRTCGIIGNPVEHTMSPVIHNTLSQSMGINMAYVPFHVKDGQLEAAVKGAYGLNILGMNVTVPYKSDVVAQLAEIDPLAEKIGAVNTLVRTEGGYKGYNTDMTGLLRAMKSDGINIEGEEVIILGAGGVGRAVAFLCAANGADKVYLLNRSVEKADSVAAEVNKALATEHVEPMALSDYQKLLRGAENRYVVIQCTSVGLSPNVNDVVIADGDFYHYIRFGYDLIYSPRETQFMKYVTDNGGMAFNGLKMLLYQALDAFELWNGCKVSDENAQQIYQKLQEKLG